MRKMVPKNGNTNLFLMSIASTLTLAFNPRLFKSGTMTLYLVIGKCPNFDITVTTYADVGFVVFSHRPFSSHSIHENFVGFVRSS